MGNQMTFLCFSYNPATLLCGLNTAILDSLSWGTGCCPVIKLGGSATVASFTLQLYFSGSQCGFGWAGEPLPLTLFTLTGLSRGCDDLSNMFIRLACIIIIGLNHQVTTCSSLPFLSLPVIPFWPTHFPHQVHAHPYGHSDHTGG